MHADGGGKRTAVARPICGSQLVLKAHKAFAVLYRKHGSELVRSVFVNGLPGFVTREADGELQTTALEIEDGKITAIYVMRNPDKLRHLY
jgi:RNA polymerase sigma-70 factor (ECF subfamily)